MSVAKRVIGQRVDFLFSLLKNIKINLKRSQNLPFDWNNIKNVCIYPLNNLGDFCMFLPHLHNFITLFLEKDVYIDLYISKVGYEILQNTNSDILDKSNITIVNNEYIKNLKDLNILKLLLKKRNRPYDILLAPHFSNDNTIIPILLFKFRYFFTYLPDGTVYQNIKKIENSIQLNPNNVRELFAYSYLFFKNLDGEININIKDVDKYLEKMDSKFYMEGIANEKRKFLTIYGRYFKRNGRCYPLSKYYELINKIIQKEVFSVDNIIFLLGKADYDNLSKEELKILNKIKKSGVKVIISDKIEYSIQILRNTKYFIGVDGGGLHLALISKVPKIISLFEKNVRPEYIIPKQHCNSAIYHKNGVENIAPDRIFNYFLKLKENK